MGECLPRRAVRSSAVIEFQEDACKTAFGRVEGGRGLDEVSVRD